MQRYKDLEPSRTIERIKSILANVDIHLEERRFDCAGFYSCRVKDPKTGCGTNGKGASEELSLASGYGEFMERLQNGVIAGRLFNRIDHRPDDPFQDWPDEQLVTFDEALRAAPEMKKEIAFTIIPEDESSTPDEREQEGIAFFQDVCLSEIVMLPYYRMGTGSCTMLPEDIISFTNATNGMSSGNTPEEALVEGMSEICERYAKRKVLNEELCPPKVPPSFIEEHCPDQAQMIERIQTDAQCKVIVMDASLGIGLPVVACAFLNQKNGSYRVKFGSHPVFAIALERCMTEHFQGAKGDPATASDHKFVPWNNVTRMGAHSPEYAPMTFSSDCGPVANRIFLSTPDWEFVPWGVSETYTNKEGARSIAKVLKSIGGDVYVRSTGYLGVPAFRVYVPGVSTMPASQGNWIAQYSDVLGILGIKVGLAIAEYERGNLKAAAHHLSKLEGSKYQCAAQELLCRDEGMPESDRDELLALFFGQGTAAYAATCWRGANIREAQIKFKKREDNLLGMLTRSKKDRSPRQEEECLKLFLRLKQLKAANPLNQTAIQDIIG